MPLPTQANEVYMNLDWLNRSLAPGTPILRRRIKGALASVMALQANMKAPRTRRRYKKTTCTVRCARFVLDWVIALSTVLQTELEGDSGEELLRLCQLAATRARRESMRRPRRA